VSGLFSIVFLAAVVGVFKPYIGGWKRWHFALAALVSLILVGSFVPKEGGNSQPATVAAASNSEPSAAATETPSASNWSYREDKDEMRGDTAKFARVTSENEVNLDFPYGVVQGHLTIRKRKEDGLSIMFGVDEGQILCHSFSNGHVSVKFDDQPIKRYGCTDTSDGSSNVIFILNETGFLNNLKKSKKVIIEAEFFQQGNQQFTFKTEGLKWD